MFCELGYPMTMEELKAQSINGFVGKVSFARLLVAKGYCETVVDAFDDDKMLMHPKVKAIHRYKIPGHPRGGRQSLLRPPVPAVV